MQYGIKSHPEDKWELTASVRVAVQSSAETKASSDSSQLQSWVKLVHSTAQPLTTSIATYTNDWRLINEWMNKWMDKWICWLKLVHSTGRPLTMSIATHTHDWWLINEWMNKWMDKWICWLKLVHSTGRPLTTSIAMTINQSTKKLNWMNQYKRREHLIRG